jgi:hypothetical protein
MSSDHTIYWNCPDIKIENTGFSRYERLKKGVGIREAIDKQFNFKIDEMYTFVRVNWKVNPVKR